MKKLLLLFILCGFISGNDIGSYHPDIGPYDFDGVSFTVTTSATNGSITLSPSGGVYDSATEVTLTPVADAGYVFLSWSGDLSGNQNPATVVMDGNKSVGANFVALPVFGTNPQDQTVVNTHNATFTASATTGYPPLSYLWYKGGVSTGQTGTSYGFTVGSSDNGVKVYCRATDANGYTNSNEATLTVDAQVATSVTISPGSTRVAIGKSKQFSATVYDQANGVMSGQTITWTATGGTIENGFYTAGESTGGYEVVATSGSLHAIATVQIVEKIASQDQQSPFKPAFLAAFRRAFR